MEDNPGDIKDGLRRPNAAILSAYERKNFKSRFTDKRLSDEARKQAIHECNQTMISRGQFDVHHMTINEINDGHKRFEARCTCGFKYITRPRSSRSKYAVQDNFQAHILSIQGYREAVGLKKLDYNDYLLKDNILGLTLREDLSIYNYLDFI